MKLLIGGSPCTHWSIAQKNSRETEPKGLGWELFKNYLIAREKYKPHYFLYENNKSMAAAIRKQITKELGVPPVLINSALVSAQHRQRLYWTGKRMPDGSYAPLEIGQPKDQGILLRNILETVTSEKGDILKPAGKPLIEREMGKTFAAKPIKLGDINGGGQGNRVYSIDGKSITVTANSGGAAGPGAGLCAIPPTEHMMQTEDGKTYPIYEVRDGYIAIKGELYPIKLADGFYIIRKLTVTECKRLQTVPDSYQFPVSPTQAYKMLGNGWTVDVIAHILGYVPGITTEPLEVLSMYDGMSCGHIALDRLGANVTKYYATEIDKYAVQTTMANYPDTIQLGDAFDVRRDDWKLPEA